jgi:hypothetical protein
MRLFNHFSDFEISSRTTCPYKTFTNSLASPYAGYCQLFLSAGPARNNKLDLEAVMAMQIILALFGCVSTCFLLWCLNGFTKALKQGQRVVGMFVRVTEDPRADAAAMMPRNRAVVIPLGRSSVRQSGKTAVRARISQREKTLTGLAVLLKLRTGRMDASERVPAMMYRKTEINRSTPLEARRYEPATEIIANSTAL